MMRIILLRRIRKKVKNYCRQTRRIKKGAIMSHGQKDNRSFAAKIFMFYFDGFRTLSSWGRKIWIIILIKIFIIFAVLKIFFFPDFLKKKYDNDAQRSEYVIDQLTKTNDTDD